MIDLSGKVAMVTGSSRGIGRACALRLAEAGADVVVNYVTSSNEAELVAEQIAAIGNGKWMPYCRDEARTHLTTVNDIVFDIRENCALIERTDCWPRGSTRT